MSKPPGNIGEIFKDCHEEIEIDIDELRTLLDSGKKGKVRMEKGDTV